MSLQFWIALVAFSVYFSVGSAFGQQQLQITISDIKCNGTVYVAIFDKAESFGKPEKALRKIVLKPNNQSAMSTNVDLPKGTYAAVVYQDINENRKIDKNMVGIPNEPFAFSNNVKPLVSAPGFKQCKFKVENAREQIAIKLLRYF